MALPWLERPLIRIGQTIHMLPWLGTVYRRGRETYLSKLKAQGPPLRRMVIGGKEVVFDISEFTAGEFYFLSKLYEPQTTELILGELGPGDVFVDIGANHGYFTVLAATRVGETGHVYAFEPNPAVLEQLRLHLAVNRLTSIVTVTATALAEVDDETARFFISQCEGNSGLSTLTPDPKFIESGALSASQYVEVAQRRFDRWREENHLNRIDWVKIDVEGAEERVLQGMGETLQLMPPKGIICETLIDGPADRLLVSLGFEHCPLENYGSGIWSNLLYRPRAVRP
jgi:FkbM family methyltransferase